MDSLDEIHRTIKKTLYSTFVLFCIVFFFKIARYPQKNHYLLMVLILALPLFFRAIVKLLGYFDVIQINPAVTDFARACGNFGSCWMVCLTVYHYTMLKLFKEKFRKYPYKAFTIGCGLLCLGITFIANFK